MSKDTRSRFKARTTLSDSHSRRDLPGHNPLYNKTQPLSQEMNAKSNPERAQQQADMQKSEAERRRDMQEQLERREAFMVKRQKPRPVLKPSHVLAHGVDRAIFNNEWQGEYRKAKRFNDVSFVPRDFAGNRNIQNGVSQGLTKEAFKAKRCSERGRQHVFQRSDNSRRGNHDH